MGIEEDRDGLGPELQDRLAEVAFNTPWTRLNGDDSPTEQPGSRMAVAAEYREVRDRQRRVIDVTEAGDAS
jgi:hypothetical protein